MTDIEAVGRLDRQQPRVRIAVFRDQRDDA
jgi:hypothetical protein